MDNLIIEPKIGIGMIKLGMSKSEVEHCIRSYSNQYDKLDKDPNYFHYVFTIEYDSLGKVNFIEVASHAKEQFNCLFKEIDIFNTKADELVKLIDKISPYERNHPEIGWTYSFPELGLSLWRSRIFNEEDTKEEWFKEMDVEEQEDELRFRYFETVSLFFHV
ncbi:hypothetical protein WGM54_10355 [Paenibacillus polymyxa]|uniref:hypothetical protein n=1 Tax=Paenibacillus polymyxa TaxID=1406 RepID=UPI00307D2922